MHLSHPHQRISLFSKIIDDKKDPAEDIIEAPINKEWRPKYTKNEAHLKTIFGVEHEDVMV